VLLVDRRRTWEVREALDPVLPPGHELVDLEDVWLGAPPLPGRVAAAEYRVRLERPGAGRDALTAAASTLLEARELPRVRQKGSGPVPYDLRPLLADISIGDGEPPEITMRTVFHVQRGTGRPEEVVAALGDELGIPLRPESVVRAGLLLEDDVPDLDRGQVRPAPAGRRQAGHGGRRR
jgi:hypothetical protein